MFMVIFKGDQRVCGMSNGVKRVLQVLKNGFAPVFGTSGPLSMDFFRGLHRRLQHRRLVTPKKDHLENFLTLFRRE